MRYAIRKYLVERPFLYRVALILYSLIRFISRPFSKIRYEFIKYIRLPYFGPYFNAGQVSPKRYPIMRRLIEQEMIGGGRFI